MPRKAPIQSLLLWGILLLALSLAASSAFGADRTLTLGTGFEFATGDYGTDETVDSIRIPVTLGYFTERFDVKLEIPWIYQSSGTTVTMGGMRFPTDGTSGHQGMGGAGMGSMAQTIEPSDSQSGLGDITLTAGYAVLEEGETLPLVRVLAYVKLPTADEEKGLGTGEFDFGGGIGLAKWFGKWTTYLEGMYVLPGSSGDFDPDNYWNFLASVSFRLTDTLRPGISLSGGTAAFDGGSAPLETRFKLSYWNSENFSFGGYLGKGLSDGSPDFGAGVFGFYSF